MKFNKNKPFGECTGGAAYFQSGRYYNFHRQEVSEQGFCVVCNDDECRGCDAEQDNSLADRVGSLSAKADITTSLADLSWDELRAKSKAAGGPATTRKACINFLESV